MGRSGPEENRKSKIEKSLGGFLGFGDLHRAVDARQGLAVQMDAAGRYERGDQPHHHQEKGAHQNPHEASARRGQIDRLLLVQLQRHIRLHREQVERQLEGQSKERYPAQKDEDPNNRTERFPVGASHEGRIPENFGGFPVGTTLEPGLALPTINPRRPARIEESGLAYANHALEYRKQAVTGASPVGLVVMLYDGALRFMEAGKASIKNRDLEAQDRNLQRAQKIVLHLMGTLDHDNGGEISTNLLSLYTYVLDQLVKANIYDQADRVDEAIRTFSELRQGWAQLEEQSKASDQEQLVAA